MNEGLNNKIFYVKSSSDKNQRDICRIWTRTKHCMNGSFESYHKEYTFQKWLNISKNTRRVSRIDKIIWINTCEALTACTRCASNSPKLATRQAFILNSGFKVVSTTRKTLVQADTSLTLSITIFAYLNWCSSDVADSNFKTRILAGCFTSIVTDYVE